MEPSKHEKMIQALQHVIEVISQLKKEICPCEECVIASSIYNTKYDAQIRGYQTQIEALAELVKKARSAEYRTWLEEISEDERRICSFCGDCVRECGEDHVDEMRELQRGGRRRSSE